MTDVSAAIRGIADAVRGRATVSSERLVGAPFDHRLNLAAEMADAGEPLIALENLCSNLHEYGVALRPAEYEVITAAAAELGMDSSLAGLLVASVQTPPSGYCRPAIAWLVEYGDERQPGERFQAGAFTTETEAQKLLDQLRAARSHGSDWRINMVAVHQTIQDWEWDR